MSRGTYNAEFKAKVVLEVTQGDAELGTIANKYSISPNMLRTWKKAFIENASRAFAESKIEKDARRKEESLKKDREQMLKTIGQLTLERDYLQDCFRICGEPVPEMHKG